ncbi:hypothetical protein Dtox_3700 [Desulfofarcimen acetoxidans DSM 771]|uniref:Uncharacterized protein n=1 Tax=Desulfofarcimen acetoxidans (strain ATCC 49208 / DSM 771 / KCTC 5769 / VKM B-1644 / 5575) TaxID=485916 RepID=C8VWP4_DESAS|nr:hypothetical protein Dtox_3700 [Desulfofarcimen acetoxidans DSM 771]
MTNNDKYKIILSKLGITPKTVNGHTAQCPVKSHNDAKNSLSVCLDNDNRILLKCHAGYPIERPLA